MNVSDIKLVTDYPDISFIDDMSLTELKAEMREAYCQRYFEETGEKIKLKNASQQAMLLDAAALIIYQQILRMDHQGKMNMLKYAEGKWLDNLGALKGISRKGEEAATTTLRFILGSERIAATSIPGGTRVTAGDGIYFATDEYAEIGAGSTYTDVSATCLTVGIKGNNYAVGEINRFVDAVPFIESVSNITVSEGGSAEETDEEYRESIYLAPDGYTTGGSEASYKSLCRGFSSTIKDVFVYSPTPNVIEIRYILNGGRLPGEEMNKRLKEYLYESERKLLCDSISVSAPDVVTYNVDLKYFIANSAKNKSKEIQNAISKAVSEYIQWQKEKIGRDINPSILIQKVVSAGAIRCEINSPGRMVLDKGSVAQEGTVNIVYGGVEDD